MFRAFTALAGAALVMAACAANGAPAQPAPPAETEAPAQAPAAFSAEGLAALEARMAQFVADGDTAGISTLLVHQGRVVSQMQAGIRRAEDGAPVTSDTLYRIYSMTKPIAAVALLMLYEDGAVSLDDPITDYIPEFAGLTVHVEGAAPRPVARPPTVREVMSHTAGFAYGLFPATVPDEQLRAARALQQPDMDAFINVVAGIPLLSDPGEQWYYSISSDLVGVLVERISGQSFGAFLEERLFAPLGMDDTGFAVPAGEYDRLSDVWSWSERTGDYRPVRAPQFAFREDTLAMESGGGGLVSSMADYERFTRMLLAGGALGDVRILQPETVALLTTNVLRPDQTLFATATTGQAATGMGYGLGVGTLDGPPATRRGHAPGSHFWGGAAGTWYWIDPENELIFIGMIQRFRIGAPPVDFRGISAELVYQALAADG